VTITAASIDTHVAKRDNDLRSARYLDTDTHPAITFASTVVAWTELYQTQFAQQDPATGATTETAHWDVTPPSVRDETPSHRRPTWSAPPPSLPSSPCSPSRSPQRHIIEGITLGAVD
jgi:hypothetical protein